MSLSDDDLLARVYGMSGGDSHDDDETLRLREVRSAFREMTDEDPPERGFAELMAAAREKAEVMAPVHVPWWRTWLRTLTRPPVLALASVMVLVGGAVLIGRHDETKDAVEPTSARSTSDSNRREGDGGAQDKSGGVVGGELSLERKKLDEADATGKGKEGNGDKSNAEQAGPAGQTGTTGKDTKDQAQEQTTPTDRPAPPHRPPADRSFGSGSSSAPAGNAQTTTATRDSIGHRPAPTSPPRVDPAPRPAPPPAPPSSPQPQTLPVTPAKPEPTRPPVGVSPGATNGRAPAIDDDRGEVKAEDSGAKKDSSKAPDAPEQPVTANETQTRHSGPRQPSIDQLVRQCQAAASRNDCAAVKSIAARIAKDDAESYRSRVMKDAAIVRCLK